jgi:hypothetical protein
MFFILVFPFGIDIFFFFVLNITSRISVIAMTGAAIVIDDASATDTILSVKERVFAVNRQFHVRRQRLVYRPGPHGMDALADDETLGGAGVAQDGTAELDVLVADLTAAETKKLDKQVLHFLEARERCLRFHPQSALPLCHITM